MTLQDDAGNTLLTLGNDSSGNSYVTVANDLSVTGDADITGGVTSTASAALAAAASTVSITDRRMGDLHSSVITLSDVSVTVGNTTGVSFGGTKILDFPEGQIYVLAAWAEGATFDLTDAGNVTPIDSADGGDISYGTTVAGDGTLTGTDVDIVPSASIDPISGGAAAARLAAAATFDGTATAKDVYVNVLIDDADVGDGASDVILVSDVLHIVWVYGGDD